MALIRSMLVGTIRECSYVETCAYSCLNVCVVVLLSIYIAQIHINVYYNILIKYLWGPPNNAEYWFAQRK